MALVREGRKLRFFKCAKDTGDFIVATQGFYDEQFICGIRQARRAILWQLHKRGCRRSIMNLWSSIVMLSGQFLKAEIPVFDLVIRILTDEFFCLTHQIFLANVLFLHFDFC